MGPTYVELLVSWIGLIQSLPILAQNVGTKSAFLPLFYESIGCWLFDIMNKWVPCPNSEKKKKKKNKIIPVRKREKKKFVDAHFEAQ